MDNFASNLRVENNCLLGKNDGDWKEIKVSDILSVKEYTFNNPYLEIRTSNGNYMVGLLSRYYDGVFAFVREKVDSNIENSFVHKMNFFLWKKRFTPFDLFRSLVLKR